MINVSNDFKTRTKKIKQQNIKLGILDGELTVKEVHFMPVNQFNALPVWKLRKRQEVIAKELKYSFEGNLFKTIMRQIEITVKNAIELKDKNINFQYGIYVNNKFEYIDIGDFYIKDIEDNKGKTEIIVTGYDKMINFMKTFKQSDLQLTYPCTLLKLIQRMCEICGVKLYSTYFFNSNLQVDEDYFTAQELTYRDVLEKVAESTLTTIFIKDNKLYLHKLASSPVEKLDASYLSGMTVKEKFGPVNALVLGRGDVEDNVEARDDTSIAQNGRCEIRFDENEFVEYQREQVIDEMFEQIKGLEYYAFEGSDVGVMWLEPCDVIEVEDNEGNTYKTIYLSTNITINTGISSDIEVDIPEETNTEYKVTTKEEKKTLKVERLAKKNEGLIQDLVKETEENTEKIASLELTSNGFKVTVSKKADTDKVVSIFNQSSDKIKIKSNRISIQSTYFTLNEDGTITATAGTIGGINIGSTGLFWSGTAKNDGFGLWKTGTHVLGGNSIIFHAGANVSNIGNAGFRVFQNGSVYARNLTIESSDVNVGNAGAGNGLNISGTAPFIDFHANGNPDFTTRIIDYNSGLLIASDYDVSIVNRNNSFYRNLHLSRVFLDNANTMVWQNNNTILLSSTNGVRVTDAGNNSLTSLYAGRTYYDNDSVFVWQSDYYMLLSSLNGVSVVNENNSQFRTIQASAFTQASSKRYKKNIVNITEKEANKILDLRVVTFDYKEDSMMQGTKLAGLIAEETIEKIPNVVSTKIIENKEVADAIDYSKLVPYLIKEVQILRKELNVLKEESNA